MKLYEQYIKDREGASLFYDDNAFINYLLFPDRNTLVIQEAFVVPELRNKYYMTNFLNRLISTLQKDYEIYFVSCGIEIGAPDEERNCEIFERYGFFYVKEVEGYKVYLKDLRRKNG